MNTFGERLKHLRERKMISQVELGNVLKLGDSTISQYESNKRKPDSDILQGLAKYFNVSIDYLLMGENPQELHTEHSQQLQELVQLFTGLSPEAQDSILNMTRNLAHYEKQRAATSDLKKA